MKFALHFKTPDVLDQIDHTQDEDKAEEAFNFARKFVRYGECITVEFDTETETAIVRKCNA